ncbi:hypothetical protein MPNT_90001 [Candidatus Methylacidithermus pantelleriae]|uniref:Uncharacterized protein n=1 Tax=Candidatus Methylacidithermus pantelleriae TaxID=2744239 RepID=A0A8J2BSY9_9BACT|nr:hypothetical protein MPNT_90001 [Candidatus Methylacidithermus pantelleriae]
MPRWLRKLYAQLRLPLGEKKTKVRGIVFGCTFPWPQLPPVVRSDGFDCDHFRGDWHVPGATLNPYETGRQAEHFLARRLDAGLPAGARRHTPTWHKPSQTFQNGDSGGRDRAFSPVRLGGYMPYFGKVFSIVLSQAAKSTRFGRQLGQQM